MGAIDPVVHAKQLFYRRLAGDRLITRLYARHVRRLDASWHDAAFHFVHVPRSAGTSIASAFGRPDPGHLLFDELDPVDRNRQRGKPALIVVRDPLQRIASSFRYGHAMGRHEPTTISDVLRYDDVNRWIDDRLTDGRVSDHAFFRTARAHVDACLAGGLPVAMIPFARIGAGLARFCAATGVAEPFLPALNRAVRSANIRSTLDRASRARVSRLYAEDIALHECLRDKELMWLP